MSGFFDRMFGRSSSKSSSSLAKERLQFILVHDRINLPPERMEAMKAEILAVISKYVAVDQDNVDIALQQRNRDSLIVAEIPFSQSKDSTDEAKRRLGQDMDTPRSDQSGTVDEADDF
ncbi:MAG: cell division topological specificity factor MinE [Chloroflexi bacterium]|nr:cell division topological specificity factor MinE [Chloroflexota bacterium]